MKKMITVFKGDGIGPEITDCVLEILESAGAGLDYEIRVLLKSPITTPIGHGFRSLNVTLRNKYDLYANIRPAKSNIAVKTPFSDVDMVIFRENTEDLYVGVEEKIDEDTVHAKKNYS